MWPAGTSCAKALVYSPAGIGPQMAFCRARLELPRRRPPESELLFSISIQIRKPSTMDTYLEFAGNHVLLVSALTLSFLIVVFTELQRKARGVTSIEPQEAVKLINADAVVIDLRSADAFARGHIVGAKNIPHDELDEGMSKLERFKSKPMVTVCDAGMTSTRLVNTLRKAGADNVYGLRGGINAWTQANLPLVSAKKTRSKS